MQLCGTQLSQLYLGHGREEGARQRTWLDVNLSFALPFLLVRFLDSSAAAVATLLDHFFAAAGFVLVA